MKKIILASLALLCGLVSFSQGKHTETRSITENGITKSWKIIKEFDAQGNMIDYDSTYVEGPQNESQMETFLMIHPVTSKDLVTWVTLDQTILVQ